MSLHTLFSVPTVRDRVGVLLTSIRDDVHTKQVDRLSCELIRTSLSQSDVKWPNTLRLKSLEGTLLLLRGSKTEKKKEHYSDALARLAWYVVQWMYCTQRPSLVVVLKKLGVSKEFADTHYDSLENIVADVAVLYSKAAEKDSVVLDTKQAA